MKKIEAKLTDYSVKAVKEFRGTDTMGFNAKLYRKGKMVAEVTNGGNGGETDIYWRDGQTDEVELTGKTFSGGGYKRNGTPEEKIFIELLAENPMVQIENGEESFGIGKYQVTPEIFIGDMVGDYTFKKEMRIKCKTHICFKLKSNDPGQYYERKGTYTDKLKANLEDKYGDDMETIYNELFIKRDK